MGFILRVLGAIILYYITKAIYNLYFHPLAKYPGPPWAAFSRIPYLVPLNLGKFPFVVKEMHDKYGPIVRLSANELSLNDARAWRDIYNNKDMLRPPQWGGRPPGVEAFNLISASAADHARFRKGLSPAFSDKATREYEPLIRTYMDKLLARFDAAISQGNGAAVIDLVQWVNFATFDIIGELTVGSDYKCLENKTGHASMDVLTHFQAVVIGASIKYYPWLDAFLASITPKSAFQALENVFQDSHQRLQARSKLKRPSHPDLIAHIESYNEQASPSNVLSKDEIEQNVLAIIVGGSETLTTSISGIFHHLLAASNQDQLDRLVKEIRSSFSSEEDITGTALSQLPYLNAVIEETLRLCPPIPDMLRRDVPSSGATIAGQVLPPGTTVSVSCYSMFKSAEHFENPDAFEPERFLQGKTYPAFHPFGVGSHNCIGQPLARLEMRLLLALVLYRYDVKMPKGEMLKKWLDQKIFWTWEKHPLNVELTLSK